jgi:hypothetical protein
VCGAGVAKGCDQVPLGDLSALSYGWHVDRVAGDQAPTIHVTVTGLTNDSKFASGFSNPGMNGITPSPGIVYQADALSSAAQWYASAEASISAPGGQNAPQSPSAFVSDNPDAVIVQISLDNGGSSNAGDVLRSGRGRAADRHERQRYALRLRRLSRSIVARWGRRVR